MKPESTPSKKIPKNFQIFYNRNKKIIILARPILKHKRYVKFNQQPN
jgi:hypothetical protein